MSNSRPFYLRVGVWRVVFWFLSLLVFWYFFQEEIASAWTGLLALLGAFPEYGFRLLNEETRSGLINNTQSALALSIMCANVLAFFLLGLAMLYLVSYFALPIRTGKEQLSLFWRLLSHMFGSHGPAVVVREGRVISSSDELRKSGHGVALVDLASAIVLERQQESDSAEAKKWRDQMDKAERKVYAQAHYVSRGLIHKLEVQAPPWINVQGPGISFVEDGEKIVSIVDLRNQTRTETVETYTRGGIKVSTKVSVVFSLSNRPEVIPVAYVGGSGREHLVGLDVEEDEFTHSVRIKQSFPLDADDAAEVHSFVQYGDLLVAKLVNRPDMQRKFRPPYSFYPERIFMAAHADALITNSSMPWHELPIRVAVEHIRKELAVSGFDDLQMPNDPDIFPLREVRADFSRRMRSQGVLSYKVIRPVSSVSAHLPGRWNSSPFDETLIGRTWSTAEIEMSEPYEFTSSKLLRDRGVGILSASFSELEVVDRTIKLQMVENWKAKWDRQIDITNARHELEAIRERNRARVQTQREMTYILSDLFREKPHAREALALRIFQALEAAASTPDPDKKIPPKEVLSMLQSLYEWLLQNKKEIREIPGNGKTANSNTSSKP